MDPDFPYSDPNFPYSPGVSAPVSEPPGTRTSPEARPAGGATSLSGRVPHRHAGHAHGMHLLMCTPMVLVVAYLVVAGKAGAGLILYALACVVMMGMMMAMMGHGRRSDASGHQHGTTSGHQH